MPLLDHRLCDAKKTNVGANSYGIAPLAMAASDPSDGIFSFTQQAGCNGVQKNPGAMAFTLIFFRAKFLAKLLVNPTIAPFVVT